MDEQRHDPVDADLDKSSSSADDIDIDEHDAELGQSSRRRLVTIYDAVAGLLHDRGLRGVGRTTEGHLDPGNTSEDGGTPEQPGQAHPARPSSAWAPPFAPEEVLFRRKHAPQRYAEHDIYFSHERDLPCGRQVLPESDLLKALHGYASAYYGALPSSTAAAEADVRGSMHTGLDADVGMRSRRFQDSRVVGERSMDETALLAFGILMEEAGRHAVGRKGDLVFTEGVADHEEQLVETDHGEGQLGEDMEEADEDTHDDDDDDQDEAAQRSQVWKERGKDREAPSAKRQKVAADG